MVYLDGMYRVGITLARVSLEHDNVRELAHLQRTDLIFQSELPGGTGRVRSNRLIHTQSLADSGLHGNPWVTRLLPGHCHFDNEHRVQRIFADPTHRVVATQRDLATIAAGSKPADTSG